ncbi:protein of unknown function [Saccharopolyspora kobensis]|uniref:Small membrane hydrophobic protein n=1 Tax=Saccharopolyspora kobensis TaxID=146035 RepID=A0A1H6EFZ6_9PSEU|nr:DUF4267 domain-containing protein [Saccharopolyspora kobensis]SEG96727.1 protein of unknown function [Saccharopolyspora kobensis]SFF04265.1 protein of unknown function [Saccharopolyspora kobensis]
MTLRRFNTGLIVVLGLFVVSFGLRFVVDGAGAAAGFGIPDWPQGNAAGYFTVKGVRDLFCAAVIFILLALGQRRALAWVALAAAAIPFGDTIAVLSSGGSPAAAFGIHAATGVVVVVAALLLLREGRAAERG